MIEIDAFLSFNIAVILLLLGKILTLNVAFLRRYSIPEPVVGGLLCAMTVGLVQACAGATITFELGARDFLLLVFFAGVGLNSDIRTLMKGGRPLVLLLVLSIVFMLVQNFAGMAVAGMFGLEPLAGLMAGSISLTGGIGTTLAWAPFFSAGQGIENAMELRPAVVSPGNRDGPHRASFSSS